MQKIYLILCGLTLISLSLKSQTNLVPNPSFETYTTCPTNQQQVYNAVGWSVFRYTASYFNACASQLSTVSVPLNDGGYQYAATGNGYMGFYTYFPSSAQNRESIGCKLISPLVIGTKYYVSFKANLCNIDSTLWYNTATDHLGILFSTIPHSFSAPTPTNNFAHIYSNTIITDTLNWSKISGSFIADSVYQYLAIGNFFDNATTNKIYFFNGPNYAAYYFIDDICVSTDSNLCAISTSIKENKLRNLINVYPNPLSDFTTIDLSLISSEVLSIIVYNSVGEPVKFFLNLKNEKILFKKEDLQSGIYFLRIFDKDGSVSEKLKLLID